MLHFSTVYRKVLTNFNVYIKIYINIHEKSRVEVTTKRERERKHTKKNKEQVK